VLLHLRSSLSCYAPYSSTSTFLRITFVPFDVLPSSSLISGLSLLLSLLRLPCAIFIHLGPCAFSVSLTSLTVPRISPSSCPPNCFTASPLLRIHIRPTSSLSIAFESPLRVVLVCCLLSAFICYLCAFFAFVFNLSLFSSCCYFSVMLFGVSFHYIVFVVFGLQYCNIIF
jgi:hypothetical protein